MCRLSWNLGASTSWNSQGLSRPVMGLLYLVQCYLLGTCSRTWMCNWQVFLNCGHCFHLWAIVPVLITTLCYGARAEHLCNCYWITKYRAGYWSGFRDTKERKRWRHYCFLLIKSTRCTNFLKFYFGVKLYIFQTILSIIRSFSPYTQQWYMSYRFADSLRAGSGCSILILLASCLQTCMTYTIGVCTLRNSWWWTKKLSETCRVSLQNTIWEN